MSKHFKKSSRKHSFGMRLRSLCAICIAALLLLACVGCTSDTTADEVATLKSRLNSALWEINTLKSENQTAHQEIDALKSANQSAQQLIDTLKSANQAAQQEIDNLKSANQAAQQEIDALKSTDKLTHQEIESLKNKNQAAQQEIDKLKGENQAAQQEIDTLKAQYEAALEQVEQLKQQLEGAEGGVTPDEPTEPTEKIKIYIDQGHNPTSTHNTGASGNGLYEQDLTFEIGLLLAELLEEDGRFEILLSRPTADTVLGTDNPSSLEARVRGATDFGADYFISLHINAFESESANGIEVLVAEQGGTSYHFGSSLLDGLIDSTGLRNRGMVLRPELYVLKNATMPAALVEMGFISNATDAALLAESPELFAEGLYDGILAYFELTAPTESSN